jgi:O-antigen/teichoic acid export membrane protein
MFGRFLLIVFLAKLLPESDLGSYGLLASSIGFSIIFLSMDYYSYSNRELLSSPKNQYNYIILNQIYAYIPIYIVFIVISTTVYLFDILSNKYFIWFFLLVFVEHISIELNRLLNSMQKHLSASFVLLLRSGLWAFFAIPIIIYFEEYKNLETVLYSWFIGVILSVFFGICIIKNSISKWSLIQPSYAWIIKGYKTGFIFILGTLSFTFITTFDKFLLESISNLDTVGIYVFYTSIVLGVSAFINAGVVVFSRPKIIKSYQNKNLDLFKFLLNKFFIELLVAIIIMSIFLFLFMPYILIWLDKIVFLENYNVFYIIIATSGILVLSSHPETFLYSLRKDKYVLFAKITSLLLFLILVYFANDCCLEYSGISKVSWIVFFTFIWIFLIKYCGYFYYSLKLK